MQRIKLKDLVLRAIFKTLLQLRSLSIYNLQKFLPDNDFQHNLMPNSEMGQPDETTKKEKVERIAHHIRLFTENVQNSFIQDYIMEQYKGDLEKELTYGHAMHEFCYFRFKVKQFINK